ncbi:class I SAM-dependent methyltransferase [Massilia arenae]|uniref:Class I SAM-dependent methyltransferase n=1 Tax=Massilia arenae TaxID=2603288 RepID=A0A5C7G279_9BURK|nr:class I SAM-dependent methyltransferase [Massilia arenae]TXG00163.1 class I SAM-dependent methyltransferase [Massilia arenae]
MSHFHDPAMVARYHEGPPKFVPGFADMQRMARVLLAERAPFDARVLVLGAGGGLELKAFADGQPRWTFDGVDPSAAMLDLARQLVAAHGDRVRLHQGYVDAAPPGPFDAAACLLTMHFMPPDERRHALGAMHARLKPGSPFVVMHMSVTGGAEERARWMARDEAFAVAGGVAPEMARQRREGIEASLSVLAPQDDEALLREAGFDDIELFYVGGVFRGWVCRA